MARPRSIFERSTVSTLPPPERRQRLHMVVEGDELEALAAEMYGVEEYDENLWRDLAIANNVTNPFTFDADFLGQRILVPSRPLPAFE